MKQGLSSENPNHSWPHSERSGKQQQFCLLMLPLVLNFYCSDELSGEIGSSGKKGLVPRCGRTGGRAPKKPGVRLRMVRRQLCHLLSIHKMLQEGMELWENRAAESAGTR